MKLPGLITRQSQLDSLFAKAGTFSQDPEAQSHWTRYLCVLTSGFMEVGVRTICCEYARNKSHQNIASFVESRLKRFQNARMELILQTASVFNTQWRSDIESATTDEMKDAVDSIVNLRNSIVHGGVVGLTLGNMKRYYSNALKVLELVEKVVLA
jgi:hypothetical protein